ncbi:MAG: MIP family channel protein [Anaerolineae bacterium]
MGALIGEVFGTFILILLGDGVVANFATHPRLPAGGYDWTTITLGWAFAVVVAVYVTAGVSGAHINPAVTIALAVKRGFSWGKVIPYIIAQMIGAFLGALGVYLCYQGALVAEGMPNVWCTGPGANISLFTAFLCEIFGTAVLLWGVLASGDAKNLAPGANLGGLFVGFTVLAVGLCLGGPSGYAINPARDFGPRVFGLLAGTTGLFSNLYWLVAPILGPIVGGIVGVFTYDFFVTPYLAKK